MHPTRIFKHPDELKKAWEDYKANLLIEAKKWPKVQYVGKDGERVQDYPVMPLTIEGFKRYCNDNHGDVTEYLLNREGYYDDFTIICHALKNEIREAQITGGLLGFYNPSITQRLNGLKEQTENLNTNNITILNIDPLDDSTDPSTKKNSGTKEKD